MEDALPFPVAAAPAAGFMQPPLSASSPPLLLLSEYDQAAAPPDMGVYPTAFCPGSLGLLGLNMGAEHKLPAGTPLSFLQQLPSALEQPLQLQLRQEQQEQVPFVMKPQQPPEGAIHPAAGSASGPAPSGSLAPAPSSGPPSWWVAPPRCVGALAAACLSKQCSTDCDAPAGSFDISSCLELSRGDEISSYTRTTTNSNTAHQLSQVRRLIEDLGIFP